MKLTELTVTGFVDLLASDAPAPGGGSAAALSGAVGIGLTAMVAGLTVGKEKYKEHEALMQELLKDAMALKVKMLETIDRDTEAFNGVTAVFKMPKETDNDKALRKSAMQEALKNATKVPFDMMAYVLAGLELTEKAVGKSNTNAASDLGVAALHLKSAIQGAWLNVLINVSGISDENLAETYRADGKAIIAKALPLADKIYEAIASAM